MIPPSLPPSEAARLTALLEYDVLDTPREAVFDDLVHLAAHIMRTPSSLVSLVDADRQWFKARCGVGEPQTPREVSFCGHVVADGLPLVVPDALADPRFSDNPLVLAEPPVRFYAGMPLTNDQGHTLGTLCVVDHRPREVTREQLDLLAGLARLTMSQLELRRLVRRLREHEGELVEGRDRLEAANRRLSQQSEHLLQVLERLETGVLVVDPRGWIRFASRWFRRQLGAPAELEGTDVRALPVGPTAVLEALVQAQAGFGPPPGKRLLHVSDGPVRRDLEVSVQADPGSEDFLWLFHDITELRLHEADPLQTGSWLLGNSDAIWDVRRRVIDLGRGSWPVLIEGETGTGKELAARAIHTQSPRKDGPFLAINCAGLTESLLTSQLFGHRRGSFTGATSDQAGLFEAASGGTLFLDEVGDMPMGVQALLLRVLETGEILRVGEQRTRQVDVRIVAATHRDLVRRVELGEFREDLLYRLRVGRLTMPPLRERRTDIPLLFSHFLEKSARVAARESLRPSPEAWRVLLAHAWPGNVRELKHAAEFLIIHCRGPVARPEDLPPELGNAGAFLGVAVATPGSGATPQPTNPAGPPPPWPEARPRPDRAVIFEALRAAGGNRSRAARALGVSRATLYRWLALEDGKV
jgi:DNA-binding NtrC family response regulator